MNIYKATVEDTVDLAHSGKFYAYIDGISTNPDDLKPIRYTSPYGARKEGGMIAVPDLFQEILVLQLGKDDSEFYYLSSVWRGTQVGDFPETQVKGSKTKDYGKSNLAGEDGVYGPPRISNRHYPQKIVIKDTIGNKLTLNDRTSPKHMDIKAELKSGKGKKLALIDSPHVDCVMLKNEEGDRMTIGSHPPAAMPALSNVKGPRSITIESMGSHWYLCRESGMWFVLVDGKDINIRNNSTGSNDSSTASDFYGNIHINSAHRDIMLVAKGQDDQKPPEPGRVFLDSKGVCQIESGDKVIVSALGGIEFITQGDFKVKANNIKMEDTKTDANPNPSVRVESHGVISLKGKTGANLQASAGSVNIKASGNSNLDGKQVHLNSGGAGAAFSAQVGDILTVDNRYGD